MNDIRAVARLLRLSVDIDLYSVPIVNKIEYSHTHLKMKYYFYYCSDIKVILSITQHKILMAKKEKTIQDNDY
jgi:hypothetical protein